MSGFLEYIHEFHPYDGLFVVPAVVSVWLFWKYPNGKFTFLETLFGSLIASTSVTLLVMALVIGAWSFIGISAGLILMIYAPICLVAGLITIAASKAASRKSNA